MTHNHLGNLQLVAQYLTILGSLALALHDTIQAREILRSSLTLAKKLYDTPTQIWVLSVLTSISDLSILSRITYIWQSGFTLNATEISLMFQYSEILIEKDHLGFCHVYFVV